MKLLRYVLLAGLLRGDVALGQSSTPVQQVQKGLDRVLLHLKGEDRSPEVAFFLKDDVLRLQYKGEKDELLDVDIGQEQISFRYQRSGIGTIQECRVFMPSVRYACTPSLQDEKELIDKAIKIYNEWRKIVEKTKEKKENEFYFPPSQHLPDPGPNTQYAQALERVITPSLDAVLVLMERKIVSHSDTYGI